MVRLYAIVVALALLAGRVCKQREHEPNNSLPYATKTGTLPAMSPQTVCGNVSGPDEDWWRIALDYQTSSCVEGDARLTLKCKQSALVTLRLYEKSWGGGFHFVGSWSTVGGWLDTGQLGLCYFKQGGLDVLYAAVSGGPGSADYFLSFW